MNKDQALQIIKNIIDQAIKAGVCPNLETSAAIATAWQMIVQTIEGKKE